MLFFKKPSVDKRYFKGDKRLEEASGGIYLPDTAKEKLREGEVIAIAEDATDEITVGDHIIYKEFAGTEVKIEGEDYIFLTEDDLLAKYEAIDKIPESIWMKRNLL